MGLFLANDKPLLERLKLRNVNGSCSNTFVQNLKIVTYLPIVQGSQRTERWSKGRRSRRNTGLDNIELGGKVEYIISNCGICRSLFATLYITLLKRNKAFF